MGLLRGSTSDGRYEPSLLHKLLIPRKLTGNEINGRGETQFRRPTPIYHWIGRLKVPFNWTNLLLIIVSALNKTASRHIKKSRQIELQPYSPVAPAPVEKSPGEWTTAIKEFALANGADLVGVRRMKAEWVFQGFEVPEPWIVMLGLQMDHDELSKLPHADGANEVLRVYAHGQEVSWNLSNWLRQSGWHARGYCGPMASPIVMLPVALAAGFGELGKHGSIINRKLGSNFRLAYVLTDMPLEEDEPDAFGADDFCMRCQVCTRECPPEAITADKQMVRGIEKWYVDFDKCVPYFNDTSGCGICLAVCPWSRPGVAPNLVTKLARRAERKYNSGPRI